jgi:hypothetical protein
MTAGAPESGNGRPPAEPTPRRDLRDSIWGKLLLLGLVLVVAILVSQSCGSSAGDISQDEAVELAIDSASFEPCAEEVCRQVRFLQQGVPPVGYWAVVLSEEIGAQGQPTRVESFLVNASSGEVTRR